MNIVRLKVWAMLLFMGSFATDNFARPMGAVATPVPTEPLGQMRPSMPAVVPTKPVGGVNRGGLNVARAKQADKYDTQIKSLSDIQEQLKPNRFTQTEAHLQVREVRDIMSKEKSSRYIPYLDIISDCLAREAELRNTHYAFYHATENPWRVAQDLDNQLSAYYGNHEDNSAYVPLRYDSYKSTNAKEFLVNELKENGLVDDGGKAAAILLSVNLSLFGNVGFEPECTWAYFLREKMHRIPDAETYKTILKKYNLTEKYIDELLALPKLFQTPEKTILQIFVPKHKVDDIAYLSWPLGIPAHAQIHQWARDYVKGKKMSKEEEKKLFTTQWLALNFKKEQERNPKFKALMKSVEEDAYSVDKYLKIYCETPWAIPNINDMQARLIFTPDVLLNPKSGVETYRYSTAGKKKLKKYTEELQIIVDKIINESKGANNV